VARESSRPRGSVGKFAGLILSARDKSQPDFSGASILRLPQIEIITSSDWCEYYGVEAFDGVVILYKGVNADYCTSGHTRRNGLNPVSYAPGCSPAAEDWDGGIAECGGGLHFSPSAAATLEFNSEAKHFIACPVRLADIVVHKNAQYPNKVKAPGVCAPCYEVDITGKPIEAKEALAK
jgi:hypothetical protein